MNSSDRQIKATLGPLGLLAVAYLFCLGVFGAEKEKKSNTANSNEGSQPLPSIFLFLNSLNNE